MSNQSNNKFDYFVVFDYKSASYPVINKIQSFELFDNKWNYGEGEKFNKSVINAAKDLSLYLYNNLFTDLSAFPGLDGEILIKVYFPNNCIEIFIHKDLTSNFLVEDKEGNELFTSPILKITDLKKQILSQRLSAWNLQESYPSTTTTQDSRDLIASHLKTHRRSRGEAYPLSPLNAQFPVQQASVIILERPTKNTQILQSFGSSIMEYYQPLVD